MLQGGTERLAYEKKAVQVKPAFVGALACGRVMLHAWLRSAFALVSIHSSSFKQYLNFGLCIRFAVGLIKFYIAGVVHRFGCFADDDRHADLYSITLYP